MSINSYLGKWELNAYLRTESVAELSDDGPDYIAINNWVSDNSVSDIEKMSGVKGLTLEINENGDFEEIKTGVPEIEWFNSEGILDETIKTFDGLVSFNESSASLLPSDVPEWAIPNEDAYRVICRYDDGDTLISDLINVIDGKLFRTINTVSDEEHLYRSTLKYVRSAS